MSLAPSSLPARPAEGSVQTFKPYSFADYLTSRQSALESDISSSIGRGVELCDALSSRIQKGWEPKPAAPAEELAQLAVVSSAFQSIPTAVPTTIPGVTEGASSGDDVTSQRELFERQNYRVSRLATEGLKYVLLSGNFGRSTVNSSVSIPHNILNVASAVRNLQDSAISSSGNTARNISVRNLSNGLTHEERKARFVDLTKESAIDNLTKFPTKVSCDQLKGADQAYSRFMPDLLNEVLPSEEDRNNLGEEHHVASLQDLAILGRTWEAYAEGRNP